MMPEPLPPGSVQIWLAQATHLQEVGLHARCVEVLDPDELHRAMRLHLQSLRCLHLLSRLLLRTVLSHYADVPPRHWRFHRNAYGRPSIANDDTSARGLRFNLSHTAGLVLLAVSRGRDIGVDVEDLRRDTDLSLADRFFNAVESAALRQLPPGPCRRARFLETWTLKESYVKALGHGLTIGPDRFGFRIEGAQPPELCLAADLDDDPARWRFLQWRATSTHIAALCVDAQDMNELQVRTQWFSSAPAARPPPPVVLRASPGLCLVEAVPSRVA